MSLSWRAGLVLTVLGGCTAGELGSVGLPGERDAAVPVDASGPEVDGQMPEGFPDMRPEPDMGAPDEEPDLGPPAVDMGGPAERALGKLGEGE